MYELKITHFNTIKGVDFGEISINKFIKKIQKGINKFCKYYYDDEYEFSIIYKVNVYKQDENYYQINFLKSNYGDYDSYYINTDGYPNLTKQFDKFCDISSEHHFEKGCYNKLENNNQGTIKENIGYINYLKKAKNYCTTILIKRILLLLSIPLEAISYIKFCDLKFYLLAVTMVVGFGGSIYAIYKLLVEIYEIETDSSIRIFKIFRLLKAKIKQLERKISKSNILISNNYKDVVITEEDLYKDNVISYMNSIMNAANKLNKEDRKMTLLELNKILDEYTSKCKNINNGDNKGLTFAGDKRQVMMATIDKLTTLQMNIADIMNHDKQNESLLTDNEKLKIKLQSSLNEIDDEETAIKSNGKKRVLIQGK